MIEVRAYVMEAEFAARTLLQMGAVIQGDYAFRDHIYQPKMKEKFDLNKEFVRIRVYQKTNWTQKSVALIHKVKSPEKAVGSTKMKEEFDAFEEAVNFLGHSYIEIFNFQRQGIEYKLDDSRIFLEDIDDLPRSIEVIAPSEDESGRILRQINAAEILLDSVPKLIEKKMVLPTIGYI